MVEKVSILSKEPAGRGESVEKVVVLSTSGDAMTVTLAPTLAPTSGTRAP